MSSNRRRIAVINIATLRGMTVNRGCNYNSTGIAT